jgi:hypothetical protein
MVNQALAVLSPETCANLIASITSNNVAVLRTLAEMVVSASETSGYWAASASRRSLARAVEILSFIQNRIPTHCSTRLSRANLRKDFRWAELCSENLIGGSRVYPESEAP